MSLAARLRIWLASIAICASAVTLVALPATVGPVSEARSADASNWNPGNIIDDALFYDSNAMDVNSIQAFLNQQVRSCRAGFTCLKDYRQNTDNRPADRFCNGYTGRANESAAQIIDAVARSCGISQKVILVLLQKEQSLVTSTAPSAHNWAAATGQGCPDTAPCDPSTAGFFYQVYYAARQYEIYRLTPTSWGYQAGRWNNILLHWDPSRNCGSDRVFIENQATAGLYIYTPYVPNAAALSNLYGEGDRCSTYGNRNFWRLYTDWFGSTRARSTVDDPIGNFESASVAPGEFRVSGWALDPNSTESLEVHIYVGNRGIPVRADVQRPDVGAAFPGKGSAHGFDARIPANADGTASVCIWAINVGAGAHTPLGCRTLTAMSGNPVGEVDSVERAGGGIAIRGWAIDPDTAGPIEVHAYVGGRGVATTANLQRPDLAPHYPAYGAAHGYQVTVPATAGKHTLCVYAINRGAGGNTTLTCREILVPGPPDAGQKPIGNYESITVSGSTAVVTGWAIDPDTTAPIPVHVYVSGAGTPAVANQPRTDLARAFPMFTGTNGFAVKVPLPPGASQVCVYAINTSGDNLNMGCRAAQTPTMGFEMGRVPVGNFESARADGRSIRASGWALDLDTVDPIAVHAYVDEVGSVHTARNTRSDVGAAFPGIGNDHGFDITIPSTSGSHSVCLYAIDSKGGSNLSMGCRTVVVP